MRVIVAGGRDYQDYNRVKNILDTSIIEITEVVCGEAAGADGLGRKWAEENKIPVTSFPANWNKYKRKAGFLRNTEMAEYAESLIAFWDGFSKGTNHMIRIARGKNIPVYVFHYKQKK